MTVNCTLITGFFENIIRTKNKLKAVGVGAIKAGAGVQTTSLVGGSIRFAKAPKS